MRLKILFYTLSFLLLGTALHAQAQEDVWAKAVAELESTQKSLKTSTKEVAPTVAPVQFGVRTASFQAKEAEYQEMDEVMNSLKLHIDENFVIIEDLLAERFAEVGLTYKLYAEQYPEKDYALSQWVSDQENKLLEMHKLEVLASFGEE